MNLPRKLRLLIGVLAIFASLLVSWALDALLGELSLLFLLPGAFVFIYLNPELMGGA